MALFTRASAAAGAVLYGGFGGCAAASLKFRGGKSHAFKHSARVLVALCAGALLVGNAVIRRLHEKLGGSFNSYYREDAERHVESVAVIGGVESAAEARSDHIGNLAALAKARGNARTRAIRYLCAENDGFYGLYYCDRIVYI